MSRNVTCKPGMWEAVTLALVGYSSAIASILYFYSSPYATLAGGLRSCRSVYYLLCLFADQEYCIADWFGVFLLCLYSSCQLCFWHFCSLPGFGVSFSLSFLYGVLLLATSLMSNLLLIGLICVRFPKHLEA